MLRNLLERLGFLHRRSCQCHKCQERRAKGWRKGMQQAERVLERRDGRTKG